MRIRYLRRGAWRTPVLGLFVAGLVPASLRSHAEAPVPAPPKLALLKPAPTTASTYPWLPDYRRVLERWPAAHARDWHDLEVDGQKLGFYGAGDRDGALTQARALLALAWLAVDSGYDPRPSGIPRAQLLDQARRSLRHLLRTHTSGDLDRVGGGRWGGDAPAARVAAALAAASGLLSSSLTPLESASVDRVVQREADRLLGAEPLAGRPGQSCAGENAAGVEALAWATALLPAHPSVPRWEDQARLLAVNSLSAPQDRAAASRVDGRPVREWTVTENLLPDYLPEGGGAESPDLALQALVCLSDAYYAYTSRGRSVPEALTHHYEDAWGAVLRLWLGGHRFIRPTGAGGAADPAAELALFPVTALLEWVGSEPSVARRIERDCFQELEAAQSARADGSFLGGGPGADAETAGSLALAALIHRRHGQIVSPAAPEPLLEQLAGGWSSPGGAWIAARSPHCLASWAWRGVDAPQTPRGLFGCIEEGAPAIGGPDQLAGSFGLEGFQPERVLHHRERSFAGGFAATGQIDEGQKEGRPGLHHFVAFAAVPGERIALLFDLTLAAQEVTITRNEGLRLHLAHAPSASARHTLHSEEGMQPFPPEDSGQSAADRPIASPWLNVDDHLGLAALYSQEPFTVRPLPPEASAGGGLAGLPDAVITTPSSTQPTPYKAGQIVRYTVLLRVAGDAATTTRLAHAAAVLPTGNELVRAAVVTTPSGIRYLIAAHFGLKETTLTLRPPGAPPLTDLRLAPLDTLVRALGR